MIESGVCSIMLHYDVFLLIGTFVSAMVILRFLWFSSCSYFAFVSSLWTVRICHIVSVCRFVFFNHPRLFAVAGFPPLFKIPHFVLLYDSILR